MTALVNVYNKATELKHQVQVVAAYNKAGYSSIIVIDILQATPKMYDSKLLVNNPNSIVFDIKVSGCGYQKFMNFLFVGFDNGGLVFMGLKKNGNSLDILGNYSISEPFREKDNFFAGYPMFLTNDCNRPDDFASPEAKQREESKDPGLRLYVSRGRCIGAFALILWKP